MPRLSPRFLFSMSGLSMTLVSHCVAESPSPPNPLYQNHMNDATAVHNLTIFILPYPKDAAQALVGKYPLLNPSFPTPEGTAPVLLQFGKLTDIRQSVAQIPTLMSATVAIPFVDRLQNNKTGFQLSKYNFVDQIVPATVASLVEGYRNELASFKPSDSAFASNGDVMSFQVQQEILAPPPAPVGGPGLSVPTFEAVYTQLSGSQTPQYSQAIYESLTSTPIFGYGLACGTITTFFNYTFTMPRFVVGNITLYGPVGGDSMGIATHFPSTMEFTNVPGITATVAEIQGTFPPTPCKNLA
ncbi:hypothetical protein BDV93DRAFT_519843 [Ceratobasidium sp. AG-I]|nr:hypothetical protein BDV93DRAFT_519843 [Ceratobasidium sp. AG-I]